MVEELRVQIQDRLRAGADLPQVVAVWDKLQRIVERRRESLIPAVAEGAHATAMIEAVMEQAIADMGQARARQFLMAARERYEAKVAKLNAGEKPAVQRRSDACRTSLRT